MIELITPKMATSSQKMMLYERVNSRRIRNEVFVADARGFDTPAQDGCPGYEDSPEIRLATTRESTMRRLLQIGQCRMLRLTDPMNKDSSLLRTFRARTVPRRL
jgi:hypothetical protein